MRRAWASLVLVVAAVAFAAPVAAQDTTQSVKVVLQYTPGSRPGLVIVPGPGLDSVRAILRRDLDFSDRFEVVVVPPSTAAPAPGTPLNYALWRTFSASYAVELQAQATGIDVRLHDLAGQRLAASMRAPIPAATAPDFRLAVHKVSDEIVRWVTGTPGVAATELALVESGRVRTIDADGVDYRTVSPAGATALSPAWHPDGRRLAYTALVNGRATIQLLATSGGAATTVLGTTTALNITPAWSPDGRQLAYAHVSEEGAQLVRVNALDNCCLQRLTVGKFADNLSPTFSPDGRRLAFVSTRAGPPQIYAMGADGTDVELLVPFDLGTTGASNAPEWSPDGAAIVFHRDVNGSPQLFVYDVASGRSRQLTSAGRNEDPTWAPDGRHIAFVSDRSGRRQLWVIDTETSRVRQIATPGAARLPAWSRRLR